MFVYNITTKVENSVADEWLQWQKQFYITGIMNTGLFYEHRLFKLLNQDEPEGKIFVLQFFTKDLEKYDAFIQDHSVIFREKAFEKWGNRFISFQTLLESVH